MNRSALEQKGKRFFPFVLLFLSVLMFLYFYRTADNYDLSDLAPHVQAARTLFTGTRIYSITPQRTIEISYLLFHLLTWLAARILGGSYELAAASVLTLMNLLQLYLMRRISRAFLKDRYSALDDWLLLGILFMTALPLTGRLYLPQGSGAIWHNPTYITMKPFALLEFYCLIRILYLDAQTSWKDTLLFAGSCLLSCFAKPSFTIVFFPAAGLITLAELIRHHDRLQWQRSLALLLGVLPTVGLLLWQYSLTMSGSVSTVVKFGTFLNLSPVQALLATVSVIALPALSLLLEGRKAANPSAVLMTSAVFACGWLQYYFLQESEFAHGNFAWGYFFCIFLAYFVTYLEVRQQPEIRNIKWIYAGYGIQILAGLVYFMKVFLLRSYL